MYYEVRKDLVKKELSVPVGNNHVLKGKWKGRWVNEGENNEKFEIFHKGKWQEAESIDFDSISNKKGGVTIFLPKDKKIKNEDPILEEGGVVNTGGTSDTSEDDAPILGGTMGSSSIFKKGGNVEKVSSWSYSIGGL